MNSSTSYRLAFALLVIISICQQSGAGDPFSQADPFSQSGAGDEVDDPFSQADWTPASSWEANEEENMEKTLLSEVEEELGTQHRQAMEARITQNKEGMRMMFESLTKNEYGKLDHSSVRYMLHRYFVHKHGWFIDGLFTEGDALNSSSPVLMLQDRVPMYVQGLFERRLGGRGFGLHELAVVVAIAELSVHQEAQRQLNNTFQVLGIPLNATFANRSAKLMVERYMTGFILKANLSEVTGTQLHTLWRNIAHYYPTWPEAQKFFNAIRMKRTQGQSMLHHSDISLIIGDIVDSFGIFQGKQCQGLKQQMTALEKGDAVGCVSLPAFYDKGLKGDSNWMMIESPDYLRHIGALDESNPSKPRVLTANYINGPNSCLQPSGYYMICCHNECDDILGQLEARLAAPSATAQQILLALPASSSSRSLRASSKPLIAPRLVHRLEEVAAHHDGRVPIHGRLFSQWLHHVYPRECPYPHLSGTKSPEWMDDYEGETQKSSIFSDEQMMSYIQNNSAAAKGAVLKDSLDSCAPWEDEEELYAPLPLKSHVSLADLEQDPHVWRVASCCACLMVVVTMTIHAMRVYKSLVKLWYQPKMLQV